MTMTPVRSAYPASIEALMPQARALAEADGLPSQNKLKETLRIGRPKAREVREALAAEGFEPATASVSSPPLTAEHEPTESAPGAQPDTDTLAPERESEAESKGAPEVENDEATALADPGTPVSHDESSQPAESDTEAATGSGKTSETDTPKDKTEEKTAKDEPAETAGTKSDESTDAEPAESKEPRPLAVWPVLLLMLPATVAIWSGWVGLGQLAGFGPIHPLPGIWDSLVIDTSITLPIGMETYSAYALYVWLSGRANPKAIKFARWSSVLALAIGSAGQVAYHLIAAPDAGAGPIITAAVACIPVAVLGLGAALAHLVKNTQEA